MMVYYFNFKYYFFRCKQKASIIPMTLTSIFASLYANYLPEYHVYIVVALRLQFLSSCIYIVLQFVCVFVFKKKTLNV